MARRGLVAAVTLSAALAGCSGPSVYERVFAKDGSHNSKTYPASFDTCWLAANRAMLGLNFGIDRQEKDNGLLQASRYFQQGPETTTIVLKANLQSVGDRSTTVYVNALETEEKLFTRSHRRFLLWLIPLPGGGGVDANRVTEASRTVRREILPTLLRRRRQGTV